MSIPEFDGVLDSNQLITLIEKMPYKGAKCAEACSVTCFYCYGLADKAYSQPEGGITESYKEFMSYLYDYLNTGEMFLPKEEQNLKSPIKAVDSDTYIGIPWDDEAKKSLKTIYKFIKKLQSEETAKRVRNEIANQVKTLNDFPETSLYIPSL